MKIEWTDRAKGSFNRIIDYLTFTWSKKEARNFATQTKKTISQISDNPYMYPAADDNDKTIRKEFINRLVSLFYKVKEDESQIDLLEVWENRKDPDDLKL